MKNKKKYDQQEYREAYFLSLFLFFSFYFFERGFLCDRVLVVPELTL